MRVPAAVAGWWTPQDGEPADDMGLRPAGVLRNDLLTHLMVAGYAFERRIMIDY